MIEKKIVLVILIIISFEQRYSIAQSGCNNRWTGANPKVTFQLKNDTIFDLTFASVFNGVYKYDSIALNSGKFVYDGISWGQFPYNPTGISLSGSFSTDEKSLIGYYKYWVYVKVMEGQGPDIWEWHPYMEEWSAIPDTVLPLQPSTIEGVETVCLDSNKSCYYEIKKSNACYVWSITEGAAPAKSSSSLFEHFYVKWTTPGTKKITVTPYNGCGTGPSQTLQVNVYSPPSFTKIINGERCREGSVDLGAIANEGEISWYTDQNLANRCGEGVSFTTPNLTSTTSYYVQDVSINGCKTSDKVDAVVHGLVVETHDNSACPGDIFPISIRPSSFMDTVNWYSDFTGNIVLKSNFPNNNNQYSFDISGLTTTKTYYSEATYNGCKSLVRKPVTANIRNHPDLIPIDGIRCGSGRVKIGTIVTGEFIGWYNDTVNQNALGSGTTYMTPYLTNSRTYYVRAKDCGYTKTIQVKAIINPIPTIIWVQNSVRCGAGEVTLTATSQDGIINWYSDSLDVVPEGNGKTFTTPYLTNNTSFFVDATSNGCTTKNRTEVKAIISNNDSCSTSINSNINADNNIMIYPSPASEKVNISVNESFNGDYKIDLFNCQGEILWTKLIQNGEKLTQINLSNIPQGMYFIRFKTINQFYNLKIIKQ